MNKLFRENSLERTPEARGIKVQHSPWTGPRNKKKSRSEHNQPLPDLQENVECRHTGNASLESGSDAFAVRACLHIGSNLGVPPIHFVLQAQHYAYYSIETHVRIANNVFAITCARDA